MRVLADRHHAGLTNSLQLLFEDRLGAELMFPYGLEWWDAGFWRFGESTWGDDRLARQFLLAGSEGYRHWDHPEVLEGENDWEDIDADYPGRRVRAVSLERARELNWDAVVCSLPDNEEGLRAFAREAGAMFVVQVGNVGQQAGEADLVLDSTMQHEGDNVLQYHQEFDKDGLFAWSPPGDGVGSFVNLMPRTGAAWKKLQRAEAYLAGYDVRFLVHGEDGPDGKLQPTSAVADAMRSVAVGWHDKAGDGYGHVIHYLAALGRPIVGSRRVYSGRPAEPFICVDTTDRSGVDVAREVLDLLREPGKLLATSTELRARLDAQCDFEAEASQIARAMGVESTS